MEILNNPLFRPMYTAVQVVDNDNYIINRMNDLVYKNEGDPPPEPLCQIHFQTGPIHPTGVNGIENEDLLLIVLARLKKWQKSGSGSRERALAITKIEEAVMWLNKLTLEKLTIERGTWHD